MSKLLISTEHFGFVLSIFIFLLSVEIKAHLTAFYHSHYNYSPYISNSLSKL